MTLTKVTEQMTQLTSMCEMAYQFVQKNLEEKQLEEEQAAKAQCWKLPVIPSEPVDSLSMGDEHLDTIPTMESDEFTKSCVENLVPNLSESEGENGCNVLACFTTFSNVLFDDDYDSDSTDDQSLSDEDVPEKIYSNPLFDEEIIPIEIDQHSFNAEYDLIESMPNHDSSVIISLKIDSFFDEFAGELTLLKSFPSSASHMEEINLFLNPDDPMSPSIEEDDDDSERDIPIFEELPNNYSLSLPANESYHFDIPSPYRPHAKPPDGNAGTLNIKMLGDVSDQKVPIPNLTITHIFNREKSPDLLSHLGFEAFQPSAECSMIINGKNTPVLDCNSGTGNSFTYDPIPESFDEVQIIPNPPLQCHFNIYLCQICESNSQYGYECLQQVPLVYEPEPCYIQNFNDNDYSHDLPGVNPLIDHHCCYKCENMLNDFFCYLCTCEFCGNGAHVGYNCPTQVPSFQTLLSFPQQYPCCEDCGGLPEADHCQPLQYTINLPIFNAHNDLLNSQTKLVKQVTSMCEMFDQFIQKKHEEEQAANARYWKILACCDDDDDYNFTITPNEPVDSLSMGDEHLNTIPTTKSNEFIKSSVENLVPNPSESEGENGCDVPACFTTFSNVLFDADYEFDSSDDQSLYDEDVPEKIFSNPLFEEEIIPMKIDQHHYNTESDLVESLRTHDSSLIISSKIDSLLDEFAGELALLKSISSGIDETDCDPEEDIRLIERLLYDNSSPGLPEEFVSENSNAEIESFSPSPIPVEDSDSLLEEINLSFNSDDPMPSGIEKDDYDSERDIPILKELLDNYSLSLPENKSFLHPLILLQNHQMEKSPGLLSHQGLEIFQPSAECPMMIHGKNTPILDVPLFHFYPLDQLKIARIVMTLVLSVFSFIHSSFTSSASIGNH
nr:hypothetical protein [Tanacetum cinerariifolium]